MSNFVVVLCSRDENNMVFVWPRSAAAAEILLLPSSYQWESQVFVVVVVVLN